eukprot:TRINITY_DN31882_c0_g1_i1.p1 TRINITY_DN31882_c0_g1~~TRINITY_DN31882_c0_g1_i1.p1  ORF type:complete len:376 (-),score=63.22 TRINITY_DN31882_c0_g1_i1:99-1226(-)
MADAELLDPAGPKRSAASTCVKLVPVLFVVAIILGLSSTYVCYHIVPMLLLPHGPQSTDDTIAEYNRGVVELIIFSAITLLLAIAYLKCIFVHPGTIPNEAPWRYDLQLTQSQSQMVELMEKKTSTGARRHCKWCLRFKPDRCHHCRPCGQCILKMDHHCPWVYNCVGFRNHKYFVLLVFYSTLDCWFIVYTMLPTIEKAVQAETPTASMFAVLFGETLASVLGLLVTGFLLFHIWLTLKAMTTIEFCEKQAKRAGYDGSPYDRGALGNICAVLGDNALLWLLPVSPPSGDGLSFRDESEPLLRDIEPGRKLVNRAGTMKQRRRDDALDESGASWGAGPGWGNVNDMGGYDVESFFSERNSLRNMRDAGFFQAHA